jgi:small neutral amino acid transporter SnatA (MarC family)
MRIRFWTVLLWAIPLLACANPVSIDPLLLAMFPALQGDEFRRLTWSRAMVIALVGNASSFFVGVAASGAPWAQH